MRFLITTGSSFSTDWLYPTEQSRQIVSALMRVGRDVSYVDMESPFGHDAFLLETERQTKLIRGFLANVEA